MKRIGSARFDLYTLLPGDARAPALAGKKKPVWRNEKCSQFGILAALGALAGSSLDVCFQRLDCGLEVAAAQRRQEKTTTSANRAMSKTASISLPTGTTGSIGAFNARR
jgi:hypothetical protein